ncbi:alpha-L-fucosidase-like isoform X2 [Ischnura elegans]|nr:alpha-L-fucosidase-like isoform X2 [Ischnura elegans]
MKKYYPPSFTYADFARDFRADLFNPREWATIFKKSGAKYIVLTSKHHEGYAMWPSTYSYNWNAMDVGPKRDLMGELSLAVRQAGLKFGAYYSLFEWYNPLYGKDKKSNFSTHEYVIKKMFPELIEMVSTYQPEVLWSDGDWEATDKYFLSLPFLAWLYNESPVRNTVVTNDRWGQGTSCKHGGYYSCRDRYNPGTLETHKWENAMTLDKDSWGYRRNATLNDYLSIEELIKTLVTTVSCGGNLLVNIGPTPYGTIPPIGQERLEQMGSWLQINGEAVYGSKPWLFQNDTSNPSVWYTKNAQSGLVYAFLLEWPHSRTLYLGAVSGNAGTKATMLGYDKELQIEVGPNNSGLTVSLPPQNEVGQWAWVLRLASLNNSYSSHSQEVIKRKEFFTNLV